MLRSGQACPGILAGTSGPEDWGFGGVAFDEQIDNFAFSISVDGSSVAVVQRDLSTGDEFNLGSYTGVTSQEGSDIFVEANHGGTYCGAISADRASHISLRTPTGAYTHGRFTVAETRPCYYNIELHLDACTECTAGQDRGWYQARCDACPLNRYKDSPGRRATFQSQELCTACPAGTDTRGNQGALSCTPCAVGMYSNIGDTRTPDGTCTACPAGSVTRLSNIFHSGEGATDCQLCAAGQYSAAPSTQCSLCSENEVTGDNSGGVMSGPGATTCLAKATCGDADGEGPGTASVSSTDCGFGLVYDTSASAAACASAVCDLVGTPADKATCCGAPATCGDADGDGPGSTGVSDVECGAGFVVRPAADATECQSTSCDIVNSPADKASCCVAVATCGDADGEGPGTASVSSTDCGLALVYDTSASAAACASAVCDLVGTPADKAACCRFATVEPPPPVISQSECWQSPDDRWRGHRAGPCDCFCSEGTRLDAAAETGTEMVACGDLLSTFLRQSDGGCQEALATAADQGYALAQLESDCCVALTHDNPLDPEDYCGATSRGVCDLLALAAALEGLMVEETTTTVQSFLLTRLDRRLFCSCYRVFMHMSERNVDLAVEGECIAPLACPNFRTDYVCSGKEIASIEDLSDAADCSAWCASEAGGASQTCCMQVVGELGAFCALGAFADFEPLEESEIGAMLWEHLPNLHIAACVAPEPRIGDDVDTGGSVAFDMLYLCFDGLLAGMLLQPTVDMVAQVCPGDFVRCQAATGCMEKLWSHVNHFGACTDRDLAAAMHGSPGHACLARMCPAEMNACWLPSGTAECTAALQSGLARWQKEIHPAEMPAEMLILYKCYLRQQIEYTYAPCVDQQRCSDQIGPDMYCQQEFQLWMEITGDFGQISPCSTESLTAECMTCIMELSGDGGP